MNCFNDIKNVYYINLESRQDRKEYVEKQLRNVGWTPNRFNAIKMDNGALGCTTSHIKCLELAISEGLEHILICEDDITFLDINLFKQQLNNFLSTNNTWDVILIAGNNVGNVIKVSNEAVKVSICNTTTGYLVKNTYYNTLLNNFKEGYHKLNIEPQKSITYAIDQYWSKLQQNDNWFLITPLTVTQKDGYSDIEKSYTNYSELMLNINKQQNNTIAKILPPVKNKSVQINQFKKFKFM